MSDQPKCPNCGEINSPDVEKCVFCGSPFMNSLEATAIMPDDDEILSPHLQNRKAYFARDAKLGLYIMESDETVICDIDAPRFTVGRNSPEDQDHVDLSDHNAGELGVSRKHVRFTRSAATITIEDLAATNGTFLNGQRLSHGHPQIVCDGDELRLGKMVIGNVFHKRFSITSLYW